MTEKKEYMWRENDTSPRTNLKFQLEVSHWLSAIKDSSPNSTSFGEAFGFLGLLFSFIFNIIQFVVLILIELVKWVRKIWPKKDKYDSIPTFDNRKRLTGLERRELIIEANKTCVIEEFDLS